MSQAIEDYFQEKAESIKVLNVQSGTLTFWKSAESIPTVKAVSFLVAISGDEIVPNQSNELFLVFLTKLRPAFSDAEELCDLINWSSPCLRKSIDKMAPYLSDIAGQWYKPRIGEGDQFEGFFNNFTKGVVEEIVISRDFEVTISEVCEGLRI